jgi:RNA polymerase sigma-B factor
MTSLVDAPTTFRNTDPPADSRLLRRYAAHRRAQDRERLVQRYLPLARYAANHYQRRSESFDDLMQVASLGLLKAIDRFDPENGASFASYAMPTMLGELRRYFRDQGWSVRPPRTLLEHALAVEKATAMLTERLARSPTVAELGAETGLADEEVLDAREAAQAHVATSLSSPAGDGDTRGTELGDLIGAEDREYARVDDHVTLEALMQCLTRREREIVRLRLDEDWTQSAIGEHMGLSQMHVSRILRDALAKLRAEVTRRQEVAAA